MRLSLLEECRVRVERALAALGTGASRDVRHEMKLRAAVYSEALTYARRVERRTTPVVMPVSGSAAPLLYMSDAALLSTDELGRLGEGKEGEIVGVSLYFLGLYFLGECDARLDPGTPVEQLNPAQVFGVSSADGCA
jgi:hypothetical protein